MAAEDFFTSTLGKGLAIGVGLAILGPVVAPALGRMARPAARAAVKSGMILYERGLEVAAEMGEVMEDLIAEARAELEEAREETAAATEQAAAEAAEPKHE
jgi:hypothetical protein